MTVAAVIGNVASAVPYFLGLAAIIVIGFFAAVLARRGHFPDLLILILLGLLIGPVNTAWLHIEPLREVVADIPLDSITPIFAAFALAVIMLDAGLNLPLAQLATSLRRGVWHTALVFVLTVAGVALVAHVLLGLPLLLAVLLGASVGGISNAVVGSVLSRLRASTQARALIAIEAILVDVFAIGLAIGAIEAIRAGALAGDLVARSTAATLAVGIVAGIVFGIMFAFSLPRMRGVANLYILTIGLVIGAYGLIEWLGGSGPLGVLMMGLILGNSENPIFGGRDLAPELSEEINRFHSQVTFLIRTFFFVLLGLVFVVDFSGVWGIVRPIVPGLLATLTAGPILALAVLGMFGAIVAARAVVARWTSPEPADRGAITLVVGRGLGSAVLVTYPFTLPEFADTTSAYHVALAPYEGLLVTLTSMLIILTVLTTAIALWLHGRAHERRRAAETVSVVPKAKPR